MGETFAGLPFESGVELADELKSWVPEGWTLEEMALRWCLDFPEVTAIVMGAKNRAQACSNAAVSALPRLPEELHTRLRGFYRERVAGLIRGPY